MARTDQERRALEERIYMDDRVRERRDATRLGDDAARRSAAYVRRMRTEARDAKAWQS